MIDVASRTGHVHNSYKAGGNWGRELFIESSSFALSTATGVVGVYAGLSLVLVATPVGWGLIIGGLAVAGASAIASIEVNNAIKNNAGNIYDSIIKKMNSLL